MDSTIAVTERLTARQRQLVDELVDLFLAEGFARLTLDEVAARLGCSKRTLYALADSKEQLAVRAVRFFFKRATDQVESAISRTRSPATKVTRYLEAVAAALRPAGPQFRQDLAQTAATREVYEQNTAAAAVRVRQLIDEGIRAGAFRQVSASFVGEVVTATMRRITSGEIGRATGLDDAQAYAELAHLVVAAVRR
jgi:AcrR family transcriptional regulator